MVIECEQMVLRQCTYKLDHTLCTLAPPGPTGRDQWSLPADAKGGPVAQAAIKIAARCLQGLEPKHINDIIQ